MQRLFLILVLGSFLTACNSGGSSGGGNSSGTPPPANNPNGGGSGGNEGAGGGDGDVGDARISCLILDPVTKAYYAGFGASTADATELAKAVCSSLTKRPADCTSVVACEERLTTDAWECTVRNSKTGDVWKDHGKSNLEAFNFAHGICSKGINATTTLCGIYEQAICNRKVP